MCSTFFKIFLAVIVDMSTFCIYHIAKVASKWQKGAQFEVDEEEKIKQALLKKALGYEADEVVEEYVTDEDGGQKLAKKKVSRKHIAPDITAIKVLFEKYIQPYSEQVALMSDDELIAERERLKKILKEGEE